MRLPKQQTNAEGSVRKVGYELEFAGLDIEQACDVVEREFGGRRREKNRFAYRIEGSEFGDVEVEYDALALKERSYLKYLRALGLDVHEELVRDLDNFVARASSGLVPCEIVLPPIAITRQDVVERLRAALQRAKAKGTRTSLWHAFGLHINVEPPDLERSTIAAYLQAFVLMEDWLRSQSRVDLSRLLTPYINAFPPAYRRLLAAPDYPAGNLLSDYLKHNATRNRPLDMLPLLAHLDPDAVFGGGVEAELVKPRPAFHYRLPNCLVDDPDWRIEQEWEQWMRVEDMAANHAARHAMGREYLVYVDSPLRRLEESWVTVSEQWIRDCGHG
ncbi:Putative amidoligase enzyme [Paucidesulfovibrio gracilis DSM 16080]|uniref:Putative amidoligase enzyme n=1 Tax=Paucidesulfovibrio gracilis DSM 16080 TaxID=1121449 RepID=A0A1T4Y508_9BACT|nr:amidoligase family protein [Paucidesulfovibrio gracilis]SKA96608.1 Putative amidoligase enzyme [Paucidesulfovibrio gracilis DSM 16080]